MTAQPSRANPIFASPPRGIEMDFWNFPASAAVAAVAASNRTIRAARFMAYYLPVVLSTHGRRLARPARDRHLHDVGQVRQLRYLPDGGGIPEAPRQERVHLRVRERALRPEHDADDRGGAAGGGQLNQTRRGAAVLPARGGRRRARRKLLIRALLSKQAAEKWMRASCLAFCISRRKRLWF